MLSVNFYHSDHLGFHNPYYKVDPNGDFEFSHCFFELAHQSKKTFDLTGFVETMAYGYCLGDRTLLKDIKRTPWMAKPNGSNNGWIFRNGIVHAENAPSQQEVAFTFYKLLKKELLDYIIPYQTIGILLRGAMDSRIVPALMKNIQEEGLANYKKIKAFTWGAEDSRDVVYAKQIASLYNWEFHHLSNDEKQMKKNIEICIENGCEFHPVHLHAMSQLAERKDIDCYIAGSFGDSIGRAEFSGKHILAVKPISDRFKNWYSLINRGVYIATEDNVKEDFQFFRPKFKQNNAYQDYEVDLQGHYMRRMLNPCMATINKEIPVYQMFSAPETFLYMWSINPTLRNDLNYWLILQEFAPELLEIPWARTGLPYLQKEGKPDRYKKNHHEYGKLIRTHFLDQYIIPMVVDNPDLASRLIDRRAFLTLCKNVKKYPLNHQYLIEARLLYTATVIDMILQHDIGVPLISNKGRGIFNIMKDSWAYRLKYFVKKIRR